MRRACFSSLSVTQPCLPAGGGRLEVRGDGHRPDLPLGVCDGLRTGNTGTLPAAAHWLHEINTSPLLAWRLCCSPSSRMFLFVFLSRFPPAALTRQRLRRLHPRFQGLLSLSLCVCSSSGITSPLQLSLPSLDLAWFAGVALPCYCARQPFFSLLTRICVFDFVVTSALLSLFTSHPILCAGP